MPPSSTHTPTGVEWEQGNHEPFQIMVGAGLVAGALLVFTTLHLPLTPPDWLQSRVWAMPAIILMSVWKGLGYNMVLFLAGLQGIPAHLYEAAEIDGATSWYKFRHITLPLLTPTTFFIVIISIIGSFQIFEQAYIMTQGGPARSTATTVYYTYENGFQWYQMGYGRCDSVGVKEVGATNLDERLHGGDGMGRWC